jgi:penicillin-binding protein 1A
MDDLQSMAGIFRRAERIEPSLRREKTARGALDIGLTERDRPGTRRSGGASRSRGSGGKRGRSGKPKRGFFRRMLRITVISVIVLTVAAGGAVAYYASKLPNITSWQVPERPPNIMVRAADGTVIANRGATGGANVTLEELPPYVYQAVVAIEDRRFYHHLGVDPIRLGRVLLDAVTGDDRPAGASTITQQLARTLFLTMDRTAERKIQEAILAVWLEIQYSKNDILEMYLNRVYFGAGAYGIDAAARAYFGKPASQLNLAEAATIAGVLPRPSAYAPTVNPEATSRSARPTSLRPPKSRPSIRLPAVTATISPTGSPTSCRISSAQSRATSSSTPPSTTRCRRRRQDFCGRASTRTARRLARPKAP